MTEDAEGIVYRALAEPMQFPDGDGRTLSGYAAVFNRPAHIVDRLGEYDEVIKPGAFKRSISARSPEVMFQHGRHPLFGPYPLGRLTELREDDYGLFYSLRMTDTWLTSPIREAIKEGAITGSSISFEAPRGKAEFTNQREGGRLRTVREAKLFELGPVVGPAYVETTVGVRSLIDALQDEFEVDAFKEYRDLLEARIERLERAQGSETFATNLTVTSLDPAVGMAEALRQIDNLSGTSDEPALARTSDEPADDSGTSDTEPADDGPAQRGPMTPADRAAYLRMVELQRRGIRAEG